MKGYNRFRKQVNDQLECPSSFIGIAYAVFMTIAVLVVCVDFVLSTYNLPESTISKLVFIEKAITVLFIFDYILRWWAKGFSIRYLFTAVALIDLLAIIPIFFADAHWQFIRILRILRILRLSRLFRSRSTFIGSVRETNFRLIKIFFTLFCIVFISAGLIHDIESSSQPQAFATFFEALYFTVVTITTVGYGDIVPISTEARAITLLMIISGVVLVPWQLTSLAKHLLKRGKKRDVRCTGCNLEFHEENARYCYMCGEKLKSK